MRLTWPVTIGGTGGPTRGYRMLSESLRAALTGLGVTWAEDAPTALHVAPPHLFEPLPGRVNALLTMVETDQVSAEVVYQLSRADLVLVPCPHNQTVLRWAGVRRPIRIVPLGLGAAHTAPVPPRPARPFRVLWVGQANPRKGWHLVGQAFAAAFPSHRLDVELVLKTVPSAGADQAFRAAAGRVRVLADPYTDAEMVALYRSAHAFVFPSYGEGWGLPVLEAMAAECLVIAPSHTGLSAFFDSAVGWVLPWTRVAAHYGVPVTAYAPSAPQLVTDLQAAVGMWTTEAPRRARARGRALTFTWDQTARGVWHALAAGATRTVAA